MKRANFVDIAIERKPLEGVKLELNEYVDLYRLCLTYLRAVEGDDVTDEVIEETRASVGPLLEKLYLQVLEFEEYHFEPPEIVVDGDTPHCLVCYCEFNDNDTKRAIMTNCG